MNREIPNYRFKALMSSKNADPKRPELECLFQEVTQIEEEDELFLTNIPNLVQVYNENTRYVPMREGSSSTDFSKVLDSGRDKEKAFEEQRKVARADIQATADPKLAKKRYEKLCKNSCTTSIFPDYIHDCKGCCSYMVRSNDGDVRQTRGYTSILGELMPLRTMICIDSDKAHSLNTSVSGSSRSRPIGFAIAETMKLTAVYNPDMLNSICILLQSFYPQAIFFPKVLKTLLGFINNKDTLDERKEVLGDPEAINSSAGGVSSSFNYRGSKMMQCDPSYMMALSRLSFQGPHAGRRYDLRREGHQESIYTLPPDDEKPDDMSSLIPAIEEDSILYQTKYGIGRDMEFMDVSISQATSLQILKKCLKEYVRLRSQHLHEVQGRPGDTSLIPIGGMSVNQLTREEVTSFIGKWKNRRSSDKEYDKYLIGMLELPENYQEDQIIDINYVFSNTLEEVTRISPNYAGADFFTCTSKEVEDMPRWKSNFLNTLNRLGGLCEEFVDRKGDSVQIKYAQEHKLGAKGFFARLWSIIEVVDELIPNGDFDDHVIITPFGVHPKENSSSRNRRKTMSVVASGPLVIVGNEIDPIYLSRKSKDGNSGIYNYSGPLEVEHSTFDLDKSLRELNSSMVYNADPRSPNDLFAELRRAKANYDYVISNRVGTLSMIPIIAGYLKGHDAIRPGKLLYPYSLFYKVFQLIVVKE
jgi:hypothetical protein